MKFFPDNLLIIFRPKSTFLKTESHGDFIVIPTKYHERRDWSNSTCGCFDDIGEFCFAFLCPICYQIKLFNSAQESCISCLFGGLVPLRTKIRTERGIEVVFFNFELFK